MGEYTLILGGVILISALAVSIYRYRRIRKTSLRNFGYYLVFAILIETCAYLSDDRGIDAIIYTTYDVVTYLFFILWFYEVFHKNVFVLRLLGIYLILLTLSFIVEDITKPLIIAQTGATLILLYLTVLFYARLLKSDKVVQFFKLPEFWITIGLLIFNLGYLPLSWALKLDFDLSRETSLLLTLFTSGVLYSCFIKAMLCPVKK